MLLALGGAAFLFIARVDADSLRPILDLPVGADVYRHALIQAALAIAGVEVCLIVLVALASIALAHISTRPLRDAQERERRFASEAAHELRTPLARIATVAQAARSGDDAQRANALGQITQMAIQASALIGDLLTLARVEHVPSNLYEPVDISYLLRDIATEYTPVRPEVRIAVQGAEGAFVEGDEPRLRRMFANVVDNAVRHARTSVTIDIDSIDDRASIAIDDDGGGIAPELREKIFERFVTTTSEGTGLGLPICRWIARAHGGNIHVTSGSRFIVDLPLLVGD